MIVRPVAFSTGSFLDQLGEPVVDRRGGLHVGGGQASHEAHVEDGQGRLHIVLAGAAGVEEGPDGLLGQILVVALAEDHQMTAGDLGGEGDAQFVPPLPGVDRHEEVVGRVQALFGEHAVEAGEGLLAQFGAEERLVLDAGARGERGP
ncbi:hypothetical protein GCM10020256_49410 [Streptomyces thermocoprophilus]